MSAIETRNQRYFELRGRGKSLAAMHSRIMGLFMGRPGDLSLREISTLTGMEMSSVSERVNELKELGLLIEAPARKCSISGRTITPVRRAPCGVVVE